MTEYHPVQGSKRRRMKGSCDKCKQRKTRCDSSQMPGGRCSSCIAFNAECTHTTQTTTKKAESSSTPPPNTFPDNFEANIVAKAHVAAIVSQSTAYILDSNLREVLSDIASYARRLEEELTSSRRSLSLPASDRSKESPSPSIVKDELPSDDDDMFINGALAERFEHFVLDSYRNRFFGRSSHIELIKTAIDVKKDVEDELGKQILPPTRRPQFWRSPWEHADLTPKEVLPPLIFPEPDLLRNLVSLYFARVEIFLCLLHRPTFEKSLAAGLHLIDRKFGATVLSVCAVAAKYSDDSRVMLEGTNSQLSSGWKYFRQLQPIRTCLIDTITLCEAQMICLCVIYLQGSSAPEGCWVLGGAGVRYAQDVGVHRRHRHDDKVLNEQWKRVFWVLTCIDTLASTFCGRPRATTDSDYDLDYALCVDDEYWTHPDPNMAFKQPAGKPSLVSYTVAYVKLMEIIGLSQKTIYAVRTGSKPEGWMQRVVAELDAALNAWVDAIPEHLRWDPHMEDPRFAAQSASLYASYYHVQIHVHRIFLTSPNYKTPSCPLKSTYPALAICASSARACGHIMDVASRRGLVYTPHVLNAICDSGVVLLLNVWGGRTGGVSTDPQKCLQDVETCLRVLSMYEKRWQVAGRQHDILTELMRATKMEWEFSPNHLKRALEPCEDRDSGLVDESIQSASSVRVPLTHPDITSGWPIADIDPLFTLPTYTADLGSLPVYEPFRWMKDSQHGIFPAEYQAPSTQSSNSDPVDAAGIPTNYQWDEWGNITSVDELVHALDQPAM